MLFDICKRHGLHLDEEPEYGGRAYLEKQDYILMKQKEKIAVQDQQIEMKEAELEEITIRISDTGAFVEEVADAARTIEAVFSNIMNRFKGMTQHISDRLAAIFQSPKKKAEIKEPIKESIRDRLARSQKRADEMNSRRRAECGTPPKRKQQNMDLPFLCPAVIPL